jgi:hypothetical protein
MGQIPENISPAARCAEKSSLDAALPDIEVDHVY